MFVSVSVVILVFIKVSVLVYIKQEDPRLLLSPLLRGDYLLSHFRSTIGVVRLNFSVRNGKRWNPHAIITLVSFSRPAELFRSSWPVMVKKSCDGNAGFSCEKLLETKRVSRSYLS